MALLPLFWDELSELWDAQGINQKEFSRRLKKAFPTLKLGKSEPALSRRRKELGREPVPDEVARWALAQKPEPGFEEAWAAYLRKREAANAPPAVEPVPSVPAVVAAGPEAIPAVSPVPSVGTGPGTQIPAISPVPSAGTGSGAQVPSVSAVQPVSAPTYAANVPAKTSVPSAAPSQPPPASGTSTASVQSGPRRRLRWGRIVAVASVLAFAVGVLAGVLMGWRSEQRTCQQAADNQRECLSALRQALQLATAFRPVGVGATVMGGLPMPDQPKPKWLRCPNDCGREHKPACMKNGKPLQGVMGVRGICWEVTVNSNWLTIPPTYEKCPKYAYDPPPEAPNEDKRLCFHPVEVDFTPSIEQ